MSDIKSLLKQYEEVNAELNKQISANGKAFLQELFTEIFSQHEGLKFVMVRGWTPGFNDGEPCTHSQETWVGSGRYASYLSRTVYDFEDYELYEEFDVEFDENDNPVKHINSGCNSLNEVYAQVEAYSEILERVYETNFEIKVSLGDSGKVVIDHDWYDCGY